MEALGLEPSQVELLHSLSLASKFLPGSVVYPEGMSQGSGAKAWEECTGRVSFSMVSLNRKHVYL